MIRLVGIFFLVFFAKTPLGFGFCWNLLLNGSAREGIKFRLKRKEVMMKRGNKRISVRPIALTFTLIIGLLNTGWAAGSSKDTYHEAKGLVVIEAENTKSPLGSWKMQKLCKNFTGKGYLQFTGNQPSNGAPKSPLKYSFKIAKEGLYYLHLYCARDMTHGQRADFSNDFYIRLEGNVGQGDNVGNAHGKDASQKQLKTDTKFFGGDANKFSWATGNRLDLGGHGNKRMAVYRFKAGQTYTMIVSGRSQYFCIDRFVFRHADVNKKVAQDLKNPESDTASNMAVKLKAESLVKSKREKEQRAIKIANSRKMTLTYEYKGHKHKRKKVKYLGKSGEKYEFISATGRTIFLKIDDIHKKYRDDLN